MDFFVVFNKKYVITLFVALMCLFQLPAKAEESITTFEIERLDDAKVFASFNDELPAVLNYFTSSTEAEIIHFYKEKYGEIVFEELKYDRLTLTFYQEEIEIRIAVSKQNNKHQVDILVMEQKQSL